MTPPRPRRRALLLGSLALAFGLAFQALAFGTGALVGLATTPSRNRSRAGAEPGWTSVTTILPPANRTWPQAAAPGGGGDSMSTMSKTVRKAKSGSGFTRTLSCPSCTLAEPQSIVCAMVATLVVVVAPMGPARQNVARDWSPEPAAGPEAGDPRWSQPVSNRRPPARKLDRGRCDRLRSTAMSYQSPANSGLRADFRAGFAAGCCATSRPAADHAMTDPNLVANVVS